MLVIYFRFCGHFTHHCTMNEAETLDRPNAKDTVAVCNTDPLVAVLTWGITFSIQQLNNVTVPAMLMPSDFTAHVRTHMHSHNLIRRDDLPSQFKFKEYCPLVFHNLRSNFGIPDETFEKSLTVPYPIAMDSPGRSGSRFLLSNDRLFIVKTLPYDELTQLLHILQYYHQYVVECCMKTLLPQFVGLYRITVNSTETYLVVMRSVFSPNHHLHSKYDLKGSTVDRSASEKERAKKLPTLKDNDLVAEGTKLFLPGDKRTEVLDMVRSDSELLSRLGLMDYSLLVGVHNISDEGDSAAACDSSHVGLESRDKCRDVFVVASTDKSTRRQLYFLAIIDILTHFGVKKRTAQAAKTIKYGIGAEISTVKPEQYAQRFVSFVEKVIQ